MANPLGGQRVVVMGLGRFGGGVGVARYCAAKGANVLVTDLINEDKLADSIEKLRGLPVAFRLGEHREEDFSSADLVVVNPAVDPRNNRYIQAALKANVAVTSEIRMLIKALPSRRQIIGVTGSAGKSTVTAMIGHILLDHVQRSDASPKPQVYVGGNLGGSLLEAVDAITPRDFVVLELSSFMLEGLAHDRWSPHVAVVTNVFPNHLDRHGGFDAYVEAKQQIFNHQTDQDCAVLGGQSGQLMDVVCHDPIMVDQPSPLVGELLVPGEHNRLNASLAIAAASCVGVDPAGAAQAVASFAGLHHRLQLVLEHRQVRYFNDSKATTPEAAMLALKCFAPGQAHVILGGYDKKADLTAMAEFAADHAGGIYTLGTTGPTIAAAAEAHHPGRVVICRDLADAVAQAAARVRREQVVLLSPGCAAWDQFDNFEMRGNAFIQAVLAVTSEGGPNPGPAD